MIQILYYLHHIKNNHTKHRKPAVKRYEWRLKGNYRKKRYWQMQKNLSFFLPCSNGLFPCISSRKEMSWHQFWMRDTRLDVEKKKSALPEIMFLFPLHDNYFVPSFMPFTWMSSMPLFLSREGRSGLFLISIIICDYHYIMFNGD